MKLFLRRFLLAVIFLCVASIAFDPVLKWSIRSVLQNLTGAKVDIGGVKTSLFHLSLDMRGFAMADPSEEMKNAVEFDELFFKIEASPLFSRKLIIDKAVMSGLSFYTDRKSSGRLAWQKRKTVPYALDFSDRLRYAVGAFPVASALKGNDLFSLPETDPDKLETVKLITGAEREYESAEEYLSSVKIKYASGGPLRWRLENEVLGQKNPVKKIKAAKEILGEAEKDRKKISAVIKKFENISSALRRARIKDTEAVRGAVSMPAFDSGAISGDIVGPVIFGGLGKLLNAVREISRFYPEKKSGFLVKRTGRGRTVEFPVEKPSTSAKPTFFIRNMILTGKKIGGTRIDFSGTAENISSQPYIYRKPARIGIKGGNGKTSVSVYASFDASENDFISDIAIKCDGLDMSGIRLGGDSFSILAERAAGAFSADITTSGNTVNAKIGLELSELKLNPEIKDLDGAMKEAVDDYIKGAENISANAVVTGTYEKPRAEIDSDLADGIIAAAKNAVRGSLEEKKDAAGAALEAALKPYEDKFALMKKRISSAETEVESFTGDLSSAGGVGAVKKNAWRKAP